MKHFRLHTHAILKHISASESFFATAFISIISLIFSSWLMFSTFSYNQTSHSMLLSSKVWSDFGAHIPMIRSFSHGDNLTRMSQGLMPEYPLFPEAPIRYHFLFYFGVGILEKIGIRIDWALNALSIIGFAGMLIAIYFVAKFLTSDWRVGILTWMFTLFNGSLTFVEYFRTHSVSFETLKTLIHLDEFVSFAPWKAGNISAFWTLNIFTNQRHLAFAFAIFFLFLLTLMTSEHLKQKQQFKHILPWGIVLGLLPFFHQPTFIALGIACLWYVLIFPKLRIPLIIMGVITSVIAIPQLTLLSKGQGTVTVAIGYLINKPFTVPSLLIYWWQNIGGHLILIPIGFILSPKRIRKYLFPAFFFFAVGFCFQFSRELAANHKFFNLFLILGNIFSAIAIVKCIDLIDSIKPIAIKIIAHALPIFCIFFLTFSGIIDVLPIANDRTITLKDVGANQTAEWFLNNTKPNAIIATASFFNHPASIAGRKLFLGWPYFAWSAGYDTEKRLFTDLKAIYTPTDLPSLCKLLTEFSISYVTFEENHMEELSFNEPFYANRFLLAYSSPSNDIRVYDVTKTCR